MELVQGGWYAVYLDYWSGMIICACYTKFRCVLELLGSK